MLQIEIFELIIKAVSDNTDKYDVQIEKLNQQIEELKKIVKETSANKRLA
ncbi:hypothetical protein GCM10011418_16390 [Sphingobacterium alkalisoli]|nr:hypothetical protein GCM10011418_16390 [Sphingobacterium alkalisoli]